MRSIVIATTALALAAGLACAQSPEGAILRAEVKPEFTDSTPEKLKQTKRVAITNVILEVQTRVTAEYFPGRFNRMFLNRGGATSENTLAGFDPALLQDAASKLYERLAEALQAAGYEVVKQEEIAAQPAYTKLVEGTAYPQGHHYGNKDGNSIVFGARQLKMYMPPSNEQGTFGNNKKQGWTAQGPTIGMGDRMRLAGNSSYVAALEVELAKALDAHVVKAWYLAGFGAASASTDWLPEDPTVRYEYGLGPSGVGTYTVRQTPARHTGATARLYVRDEQTRIAFRTPDGSTSATRESSRMNALTGGYRPYDGDVVLRLDNMVPAEAEFVKEGVKQTNQPENTASRLLGAIFQSRTVGDTNNTFETSVMPDRFAAGVLDMVSQVQWALVGRLKN